MEPYVPCHTYAQHLKLKASTSCPSIVRSILGSTAASTHAHTSKVTVAIFHEPIFTMDQRIDLAILAVNATTTSYSANVLRKSIKPRQLSRPRCARRLILAIINEVDANCFAAEPLQPAPSSDIGDPDLGFPLELPRLGDEIDLNKEAPRRCLHGGYDAKSATID
jgi:hypothetical protein